MDLAWNYRNCRTANCRTLGRLSFTELGTESTAKSLIIPKEQKPKKEKEINNGYIRL